MIEVFRGAKADARSDHRFRSSRKKGRGCDFAERDATKFHGPGAYDPSPAR